MRYKLKIKEQLEKDQKDKLLNRRAHMKDFGDDISANHPHSEGEDEYRAE